MRDLLSIIDDFIDVRTSMNSPRGIGWDERQDLHEERRKLDKEVEEWLNTKNSNPNPSP